MYIHTHIYIWFIYTNRNCTVCLTPVLVRLVQAARGHRKPRALCSNGFPSSVSLRLGPCKMHVPVSFCRIQPRAARHLRQQKGCPGGWEAVRVPNVPPRRGRRINSTCTPGRTTLTHRCMDCLCQWVFCCFLSPRNTVTPVLLSACIRDALIFFPLSPTTKFWVMLPFTSHPRPQLTRSLAGHPDFAACVPRAGTRRFAGANPRAGDWLGSVLSAALRGSGAASLAGAHQPNSLRVSKLMLSYANTISASLKLNTSGSCLIWSCRHCLAVDGCDHRLQIAVIPFLWGKPVSNQEVAVILAPTGHISGVVSCPVGCLNPTTWA